MDLSGIVQSITVQTTASPDIVLDKPFAPGEPNLLLSLLKPKIIIQLSAHLR
jgi:hypothetical protein